MRIGITCYPTYGGSGIVATELGKELAEKGHEIHFISYALPMRLNRTTPNIYFHEVEISNYPLFDHPPYALALANKMAEVAALQKLDVLHCHYAIPHSVSAFLAKSMLRPRKLPVVTTLHGTDITLVGADRSYLSITKFSIEQSDGVTAVSHYLKNATCETFGICDDIEVIYNFVNCDIYKAELKSGLRERFAAGHERVLIHLSNFRAVKKPDAVIEIFFRVQRQVPSVLLMVGDGPERSGAEWLAHHYGIDNKVRFLGKRDNIDELIAAADVLLLPSQTESFGLVALEAMACEVPVVVSKVGGLPEVVTDGKEGFLVDPQDTEKMAARVLEILTNDERRRAMGKQGRATARARFCADEIVRQYEMFYERVLKKVTG